MELCQECGDVKYPNANKEKMDGITVSEGECPQCKKTAALIPERDYQYACGDSSKWD